ncbi:MAG TPA: hypothetical protein VGH51_05300 [Candidatus Angelobacter sp.]|jgi:hypothetical protein
MTDKDRIDALMRLAELQSDIREKRREIEFKVSIGLWAITGGAVAYLKGYPVGWSLLLLAFIVLMHSWLWVRTHYNSSERDAIQVRYYMEHALLIARPESGVNPVERLPIPKFGTWKFVKHQPLWFEIAVTPVLGLIVILVSHYYKTC